MRRALTVRTTCLCWKGKCMLNKTTVNQPSIQHKRALSYLIQDEQALWQVCLINALYLLQLFSSFQTDRGLGIESPQSRIRLYTKHCQAAAGERCAGAEAAREMHSGTARWWRFADSVLAVCDYLLISLQGSFTKRKPALHPYACWRQIFFLFFIYQLQRVLI